MPHRGCDSGGGWGNYGIQHCIIPPELSACIALALLGKVLFVCLIYWEEDNEGDDMMVISSVVAQMCNKHVTCLRSDTRTILSRVWVSVVVLIAHMSRHFELVLG